MLGRVQAAVVLLPGGWSSLMLVGLSGFGVYSDSGDHLCANQDDMVSFVFTLFQCRIPRPVFYH